MYTIAWIGFSQGLFATLLMFSKRKSSVSDKILSIWLCLLSIEFLTCALDYQLIGHPLLSSSFLLFNPALYFYIKSLTSPNFRLKGDMLYHLLPYMVFEILVYIIQEPFNLRSFFIENENFAFRILFLIINGISWLIYTPASIYYVHIYRKKLWNEESHIEKNEHISWVLFVSIFYLIYCILSIFISFYLFIFSLNSMLLHIYNYAILLSIVYILSFYGLFQRKVPDKILKKVSLNTPYKNSLLSEDLKQMIKKTLIEYIETKKVYLNPNLNMDNLSAQLNIPKHQLTEVLNTVIGQNFFHLINSYRVHAVKEMLNNPKIRYSIEAIGYECGFASKTAFFCVFKRFTGKTPLNYRNSIKKP